MLSTSSLLLAAFTLGPMLGHSKQVSGDNSARILNAIWSWTRWPISAIIILASATVLLAQESPSTHRRWRISTPGALATVLGWTAATALLPIYVATAAHASPTLGSLGGGLIILAWLYLLNLSLFLGAEINAARHDHPPPTPLSAPLPADDPSEDSQPTTLRQPPDLDADASHQPRSPKTRRPPTRCRPR